MNPGSSQAGFSRRAFLRVAAATAALGLGSAAFVRTRLPDQYPAVDGFVVLDPHAAAVLRRLADIWLPRGEGAFIAWPSLPVLAQVDAWLGRLTGPLREQFLLGVGGFDYAAFVYGWYGEPFTELEPVEAADYVDRWFAGRGEQKGLVGALRQVLHLSYWRFPETWPATGYQGPLHLRADIPSLGAAPMPS